MGRGVWADGQDRQEWLEDDLAGKLVQLESIWLPATGRSVSRSLHALLFLLLFWETSSDQSHDG